MDDVSFKGPTTDATSPTIDPVGISLDQLAKLDDTILTSSLKRILGDVDKPDNVVFAGFNASI